MLMLFRIVALLSTLGVATASIAQDVDDLFAGSEETPLRDCRHQTFSLDDPPDWMPDAAKATIKATAAADEATAKAAILYCPTTNAVIEQFPFKRAYRFLVCPSDWKGFKPKQANEKALMENGIPIDKIRAMFQITLMGPIEVSFRSRHSRDMMGRIDAGNK